MTPPSSDWLKLAPYGDHPHSRGLQRLTPDDARAIVMRHNSILGHIRRALGGLPIYIGHPDEPTLKGDPAHSDTRAYGWIHEMAALDDGLWILPRWSAPGKELIDNAHYKFFSPRWKLKRAADGRLHPFEIVSVGLTNNPNIDSDAIAPDPVTKSAVANSASEKKLTEKTAPRAGAILKKLLSPLVSPLAKPAEPNKTANSEEANQETAVEVDKNSAPAAAPKFADDEALKAKTAAELAAIAATLGLPANTPIEVLVAAVQAFALERLARIEAVLDLAESRGKIAASERTKWKSELQRDFTKASNSLAESPAEPEPFFSDIICNSAEADDFLALVTARQAATGETFLDAWNALKGTHRATFDKLNAL